jgi:hypothetical protein
MSLTHLSTADIFNTLIILNSNTLKLVIFVRLMPKKQNKKRLKMVLKRLLKSRKDDVWP